MEDLRDYYAAHSDAHHRPLAQVVEHLPFKHTHTNWARSAKLQCLNEAPSALARYVSGGVDLLPPYAAL
jgi:hypothetical protein